MVSFKDQSVKPDITTFKSNVLIKKENQVKLSLPLTFNPKLPLQPLNSLMLNQNQLSFHHTQLMMPSKLNKLLLITNFSRPLILLIPERKLLLMPNKELQLQLLNLIMLKLHSMLLMLLGNKLLQIWKSQRVFTAVLKLLLMLLNKTYNWP